MTRVVRFGDYEFEDRVITFNDNFADLMSRTTYLPGLSGGYPEFGTHAPPQGIGQVSYRHQLEAMDADDMRRQLDALRALIGYGMKKLVIEPAPGEPERFCWAVLNNIQMSENVRQRTDRSMEITLDWQVSDPRWYRDRFNAPVWGSFEWGDGSLWGGSLAPTLVDQQSTDFTITPDGNAPTALTISLMTTSTQSVHDPTFQRLVNGQVVDEVKHTGTLGANKTLVIDPKSLAVRVNSLGTYAYFSARNPHRWMELQPGANTIRVLFGDAGDEAYVRFTWLDAWY